jgi:hypothetical protein
MPEFDPLVSKKAGFPFISERKVNISFKSLLVDPKFSVIHSVTSSAIPLHTHSEYVVGYYFSGRSQCRFGSKVSLEFRQGDTGLLNPGDAHEDLETRQCRDYLTVSLKKKFFEDIILDIGCGSQGAPRFLSPQLKADRPLKRLFECLKIEVDGQGFGREILLQSFVIELAVYLCIKPMQTVQLVGS